MAKVEPRVSVRKASDAPLAKVNILLEEERRAGVAQVVRGDLGQIRTLQERREGSLMQATSLSA